MPIDRPLMVAIYGLFVFGIIFGLTAIIGAVMRLASKNVLWRFFIAGVVMIVMSIGCNLSFQIGQMTAIMRPGSGGSF